MNIEKLSKQRGGQDVYRLEMPKKTSSYIQLTPSEIASEIQVVITKIQKAVDSINELQSYIIQLEERKVNLELAETEINN